jgi:MoaA/NifB/PqqE/SkfB family radical SAM enzyme
MNKFSLDEQAISLAARGNNMPCMTLLFTTGYGLTPQRAMALKEAGLFGIAISLDRVHAKDHDRMRGVEGAFVQAVNAIQFAKSAGLYTMTQTMCTRELLETDEIMKLAKLAKSLGVDEMRIMEPIPCGTLNEHRDEVLTAKEQKDLIELHIKMNHNQAYPKVSVFPYVESEDQYGCGAGSQHSFVDASGNFGPYDFLPMSYGNLLTEEVTLIWRRMHQDIGKPKCECYAKCKKTCGKLPKYYRLLAGDQ